MKKIAFLFLVFLLLAASTFSNPGPGIRFLVSEFTGDTVAIILGRDTMALLSVAEVRTVNLVKLGFDHYRQRTDSLEAMMKTCKDVNRSNEGIIFSQAEENRLLNEAAGKDRQIQDKLNEDLKAARKAVVPWKISTMALAAIILVKIL